MQKNPVYNFILHFIFMWFVDEMGSGGDFALKIMNCWRAIQVQKLQIHSRFAPEIKVSGLVHCD